MQVRCKEVKNIKDFVDIAKIRIEVFTIEQKSMPGRELDEHDKNARHFVAIADNKIVSAARARISSKNEFKIGRMATLKDYRRKEISKNLI